MTTPRPPEVDLAVLARCIGRQLPAAVVAVVGPDQVSVVGDRGAYMLTVNVEATDLHQSVTLVAAMTRTPGAEPGEDDGFALPHGASGITGDTARPLRVRYDVLAAEVARCLARFEQAMPSLSACATT